MLRHAVIAISIMSAAPPALAQYAYGNNSGNSYNSYGSSGSRTTNGYNSSTGSTWSSTTHGSQTYGTDSRGNSWSYDRNSGSYSNYGTGESRIRGQRY